MDNIYKIDYEWLIKILKTDKYKSKDVYLSVSLIFRNYEILMTVEEQNEIVKILSELDDEINKTAKQSRPWPCIALPNRAIQKTIKIIKPIDHIKVELII